MKKKVGYGIEYVLLVIFIILLWEVMNLSGNLNPVILPAPEKVWDTFWGLIKSGTLFENLLISLSRVLKGYFLAMISGLVLGVFIGLFEHVRRLTDLLIQIIKPIRRT